MGMCDRYYNQDYNTIGDNMKWIILIGKESKLLDAQITALEIEYK